MRLHEISKVEYPGDDRTLHKALMIEAHNDEQKFLVSTVSDRIALANELHQALKSWDAVKDKICKYLGGKGVQTGNRVVVLAKDFDKEVASHVGSWPFVVQAYILGNSYLVGERRFKLSTSWAIAAFERLRDNQAVAARGIASEALFF